MGFIRNLPKDLIEAFAATLEELKEADLLIHLIDISNPHFEEHIETVEGIIDKLNLTHIPVLKVFNKKDLVSAEYVAQQCQRYKAIAISAIQPETLPLLVKKIENILGNFSSNNPGRN